MDFRDKGLWHHPPFTPAKPIPTRPTTTIVGEGNQGGGRPNWIESMGFQGEFLQGGSSNQGGKPLPNWIGSNGLQPEFHQGRESILPNAAAAARGNSTSFVDQSRGFNNWDLSMSGKQQISEPSIDTYAQAMNNTNPMNMWNSVPFGDLLALANAASSTNGRPREGNNAAAASTPPYFPFFLPELDNNQNQPRMNSTNISVEQSYSINTNSIDINNHTAQMPQNGGYRAPYSSTYDLNTTPRTMYDLNSCPSTISDAALNGNISFKNVPATPDKGGRMQRCHVSGGVASGNMSLQYPSRTTQSMNSRVQNGQLSDALTNGNVPLQCASRASSDRGSRMQHGELSDALQNGNVSLQHGPITPADRGCAVQLNQYFDAVSSNNEQLQMPSLTEDKWGKLQHLMDAVSNGHTMSSFAPVTPDKGKSPLQVNHASELVTTGRIGEERNKSQGDSNPKGSNYLELPSSQESCLGSVVNPSPATLDTPSKENHQLEKGAENEFDLNKTPQQKPRKKKHRPKVFKPDKPAKTPKSTAKQNNPQEPQRAKRKYVRKNVQNTPETPLEGPSKGVDEKINDADQSSSVRSCKRSINFDRQEQGDESQPRNLDETPATNLNKTSRAANFNNFSESQVEDLRCRNNNSSGGADLQFSQVFGGMGQRSLADVAIDLNRNASQVLDEYISLPARNPQPTRRELLRQNLKDLGRDGHECENSGRQYQQQMEQPGMVPQNIANILNNFSCSQRPPLGGNSQETVSKRANSQTMDEARLQSFNLIGANPNSPRVFNNIFRGGEDLISRAMLFPEIHKKRRTEKSHTASRVHMSNAGVVQREAAVHVSNVGVVQREAALHFLNGASTSVSPSQRNTSLQSNASCSSLGKVTSPLTQEYSALSSSPREYSHQMQNMPADQISTKEPQRNTSDKMSELMLTIRQTEVLKTRKRSKAHTRVRDLASLTMVAQCNNLQSPSPRTGPSSHDSQAIARSKGIQYARQSPSVNHADMAISKYNRKRAKANMLSFSITKEMRLQEAAENVYRRQYSTKSRGTVKTVQRFNSPIDEIVYNLQHLSLSEKSTPVTINEQNALVPYKGDDRMVPYDGPFDPIKRRKPRPKVDIDPETDRVWRALMGPGGTDGINGTDAENEKYWEEQRGVFRGRADSFIARMHLIQGDRRFTKWNGSVLDSVIGVFLTQNVSDHLSSSAFMSLAARFPRKPRYDDNDDGGNDDDTGHGKGPSMYVEEPEAAVESIEDKDSQGSVILIEEECIEDKETDTSSESHTGTECASFVEVVDGRLLEVESSGISSQNSVGSSVFQATVGNVIVNKESDMLFEDAASSRNTASTFIYKNDEAIKSCSDSNSDEVPTTKCTPNVVNHSTSFMELLTTITCNPNPGRENLLIDLNSQFGYSQPDPEPSNSNIHYTEAPTMPAANYSLQSPKVAADISGIDMTQPRMSLNLQGDFTEKQQYVWKNVEVNRICQPQGCQSTEPGIVDALGRDIHLQQTGSNSPNFSGETLDVVESAVVLDKKDSTENTDAESIMKEKVYLSNSSLKATASTSKPKAKPPKEKKKPQDWDYLRKDAYRDFGRRERTRDTMDSLDWEAVRAADEKEIADAIKERGMNNMLAERIKDFLDRIVREHEEIDLEWLRDVPGDKAKEYLLSVRGLGLKSVECVRLLTLHQLAFPVDTNVGRIAVRLGWVPLQPLPESLQLHLLELYPILESIQKYLWPRLCKLDQQTLYELHYQLITFGKVFCTKSKPNCNACPMRADCRHFASAFASARLALPGPEEKGIVSSTAPTMPSQNPGVNINPMSLTHTQANVYPEATIPKAIGPPEANTAIAIGIPDASTNMLAELRARAEKNEPIIEVPASPEPECHEIQEISDIEDAFYEDPDEIPTIKLNIQDFAMNLQNYMQGNNMAIQDGDVSKALVALNTDSASLPTQKLKNVSRLRTEHQVYELPDSHPLLKGVEKRVPNEVCSYLLAIWTPGETAESTQPPEGCCASQASGNLCTVETCFSCNSIREAHTQTVRGTLLIPSKTAMRGSFPLNGTYFQVNEVFADHASSLNPIDVPRAWLWNLPRRTVYFGTSIPTIFKGQTTEQIQHCFWRGYVCVRGFDQKSRAPKPLMARLHFPQSKLAAAAKARGRKDEE
ncbi:hypothetical protein ACHQM5_020267 [Ranunculus cassubicifolius]